MERQVYSAIRDLANELRGWADHGTGHLDKEEGRCQSQDSSLFLIGSCWKIGKRCWTEKNLNFVSEGSNPEWLSERGETEGPWGQNAERF